MAKIKEADKPIGLDVELSKTEAFIEKNLKKILIAVAAVIVVVSGYFIYRHYMGGVEKDAQDAIAKSQQAFAQGQFELALNGDGANEKGLLKVIDEYSGTKTANLAKLYAGLCYAQTGKTDEAIRYFEDYDQQDDQIVSPLSYAALANCYVDKGESQKGIDLFLKAAKAADNESVASTCLFQAAEIYESIGKKAEAKKLYEQIKNDYFRSALSAEMDKYIERVSE